MFYDISNMSISFEGFERLSPEALEDRVVSEAFKKASEKVERDRIKPEDFSNLYSPKSIQDDLDYVNRVSSRIERDDKAAGRTERLGLVFEEIVSEQIELNEWLGPDNTTKLTSRFDDLKNGVDAIVEMREEIATSYLALAFDLTTGLGGLASKFERIKDEIDNGTLASVKYFENTEGTFRGELSKVPRIIIGVDNKTATELAKLWLEKDNKALAEHPAQIKIIEEALIQLGSFKIYAEQVGNNLLANIYERQIKLLNNIKEGQAKKSLYKKLGTAHAKEDGVFNEIARLAHNLTVQSKSKEVKYIPLVDRKNMRRPLI